MKRFMLASIGLLCLSLAVLVGFHLGNHAAHAQAPRTVVGTFVEPFHYVMLENGDVYYRRTAKGTKPGGTYDSEYSPVSYIGNYWDGGTVPVSPDSTGQMKAGAVNE